MKYAFLALIYLFVLFMAWSAFGGMGVAYVIIVPVPLFLFSYMLQKKKQNGSHNPKPRLNWWSSPIPYLSCIFVGFIVFQIIF